MGRATAIRQPWRILVRQVIVVIALITEPSDQLRRATQTYDQKSNPKTPPSDSTGFMFDHPHDCGCTGDMKTVKEPSLPYYGFLWESKINAVWGVNAGFENHQSH